MKLSVLMPVYKPKSEWLIESIQSIINQTFKDWELLILDDNPKDEKFNYKSLLDKFNDKRIKFLSNGDNLNVSKSMNKLINIAQGEYLAWHDYDDISDFHRFEKQIKFLDNNKSIDVVSAIIEKFGKQQGLFGNIFTTEQITKNLVNYMAINNPVIMVRKESLLKGDLYDESYTLANDYELWSRRTDLKFAILPDVLLKYRIHDDNTTNNINELRKATIKIINRNINRESQKLKVALVCIAKNEDEYINEWIKYHLKLGFDKIYVYCNDWNWQVPKEHENKIIAIEFNGLKQQIPAYNNFVQNYYNKYDFAAFTDIDEYIVLKNADNIKRSMYNYRDIGLLRIPIRTMGNNNLEKIENNNYSVIDRFIKGRKIYESIGKYIVNFNIMKNKFNVIDENWFGHLPCTNPNKTITWNNYYNYFINDDNNDEPIELYHYITKTWEEYLKRKKNTDARKGILNYPEDKIRIAYDMVNNKNFANAKNYTEVYDFYHDLEKRNTFIYNFTIQFNSKNNIPIIKELYVKESAILLCKNKVSHIIKLPCDFDGIATFKNIQIQNGTYYIRGLWKEGYYNFTKNYIVKFENGKIYYKNKEVNKIIINNVF